MKSKSQNRVFHSEVRVAKFLIMGIVILLLLGCVASELVAYQPNSNMKSITNSRDGGNSGMVAPTVLLLTFGLMFLFVFQRDSRRHKKEPDPEEMYRVLFEESPTANLMIDSDSTIRDVSRSVVDTLGYSKEQLIGRSVLEFVVPEQKRELTQLLENVDVKKVKEIELSLLDKKDQVHTFLFSSNRMMSVEKTDSTSVLAVGIDITKRKRTEQALKKERQRLFSVLDVIPAFVYLQAPDYSVPFINRKFRDLFGDPKGRPCYEAFYGRRKPCDPCITLRVLQTRAPQTWEWTSREGCTYLIHEDLFPSTDGEEMVMEIGLDITERKKTEQALRISKERYKLATQTAKVGVWDWNLKTGDFYLDPNIKAALGYADHEIPNDLDTWTTYVHPDDKKPVMEAAQAHIQGRTPEYVFEHRMRHKDGSYRWILVRGQAIRDAQGDVVRMVGTDTDVTEQKQNQQLHSTLYRIANATNTTKDLTELLQTIRAELGKVLDTTNFLVALRDKDTGAMSLPYLVDEKDTFTSFPSGKTRTAWILKNDQPLLLTPELEKKLIEAGEIDPIGTPSKSWLGVPLKIGHEAIGVVIVGSYINSSAYGQRELEIMQFASEQIAIAIQRKKAEEALRYSEQRYRLLFERNQAAVYQTTLDGIFIACNQAFARLSGYESPQEVLNHKVLEFYFDSSEREKFLAALQQKGALVDFESRLRRKDGSPVWLLENVNLIKGNREAPVIIQGTIIDITERKKAEEALRKSETILNEMGKIAHVGGWEFDVETLEQVWTEEVYRIHEVDTNYKPTVSKGIDFYVPSAKPIIERAVRRAIELGESFDMELEFITAKKNHRWVRAIGKTYRQNGKTRKVFGTFQDITERKRAEETLRESEEKYRLLFENANDAIYLHEVSREGPRKIFAANEAACRMLGYTQEEFLRMTVDDIDVPEQMEKIPAILDQLFSEGYAVFETEHLRKDRSIVQVLVSIRTFDLHGTMVMLSIVRDITERKRIEEALRDSEEKWRSLTEYSPDYVMLLDRDNRILFINHTVPGLTRKQIIDTSFFDYAPKEYEQPTRECFERVLQTGQPDKFESIYRYTDGTLQYFESYVGPVRRNDEIIGLTVSSRDITERKRMEEALRESEERFRRIIENASFGYYRVGKDELWQYVNPVWERMHGLSLEEVIGKSFEITQTEDSVEQAREIVKRALAGETITDEFSRLTKNGSIEYHNFNIQPVRQGEEIVAIEGFINDITERKHAEEALRESEERFRIASQISSDVVYERDGQTGIATFYGDIDSHLGYEPGEYPHTMEGWRNHVHPEDLTWIDNQRIDQLEPGVPHSIEYRMRKKDGTYMTWSDRIMIIRDKKTGKPLKFIGTATDITKRKRAEKALRESEKRYRSIFDQARDGIVLIDVETGRIMDCNAEFENQTGRNRSELQNMNIWELRPPEKIEVARRIFQKINEVGMGGSAELEFQKPDGEIVEIDFAGRAIDIGGKRFIQSMVRDITDKKKMEAQLIQAERLTAVGTLAYGIAHEFNNIVAGILGNVEFGMGNDDPQEVKECFQVIMENCDRARSITNHLLAFTHRQGNRKETIDLTHTLESVLGLIERELQKENMKVERKFSPVPLISCDPGEFSEVFLNMITNARDAMKPDGGTLTINIKQSGDNLEIIFTDTGCGIPQNIRGRIFEPFVTTKGALGKSEIPGTGLGLFLSIGIISRYHGQIEVESREGKGSTFTIRIPISENQMTPGEVEAAKEKPASVPLNLRILLVDDEKPICDAVKKNLEAEGHSVVSAAGGKKGLKLLKHGSFDLVLSDITMPDMDGIKLISKFKSIRPHLKLIALTGHIEEEKLLKAKKAGADHILTKPFKREELFEAIGQIFTESNE